MWVKLDDEVFEHPKMIAIGIQGRALWLAGLCYANKQTTDGFIPEYMLRELASKAGVTDLKGTVAKLTTTYKGNRSPVWHPSEDGYQIHDYAEYQFTADRIADMNAKRHEAAKVAANARWHAPADADKKRDRMRQRMRQGIVDGMPEGMRDGMRSECPVPESRTPKKNLPRNAGGVTAPQGALPAAHGDLEERADPFEALTPDPSPDGRGVLKDYVVDDDWYEEHLTPRTRPPVETDG
jgi:hypothetical protein